MDIKTDTLHYRMIYLLGFNPPTNLCGYFWLFVIVLHIEAFLLPLIALLLLSPLIYLITWLHDPLFLMNTWSITRLAIPMAIIELSLTAIILLSLGVKELKDQLKKHHIFKNKSNVHPLNWAADKLIQTGTTIKTVYKALKDNYCPIIKFTD